MRVLRSRLYLLVSAALLSTAVALVGGYLSESAAPPAPAAARGTIPAPEGPSPITGSASTSASASLPAPETSSPPAAPPPFTMAPSPPVSVRVSAIGVESTLLPLGKTAENTVEVPVDYRQAGWYSLGPTPGSLGPAVILGHVDSYQGPGVFYQLGDLQPGQIIDVTRADQSVAHFRVDAVATYPKAEFPTQAVYGDISYSGLRLITCGGTFDENIRSYESNIVVYASLIGP